MVSIDAFDTWLVDLVGNVAATGEGLGILERIASQAFHYS